MNEKALVFLEHVQESILIIHEYTDELTEEQFLALRQAQDSVIRRLEIIGEAVKNIPVEFRDQYPDLPWKQIAGLRDVLIHQYMSVDLKLTWRIVKNDLPSLEQQIEAILGKGK